jgi:hypothetical protein
MPTKIFVSYSWDDEVLRSSVVRTIESVDGVVAVLDQRFIGPSERHLHKRIHDEMLGCDAILVLLTKGSSRSVEVREEIVLANEWNMHFLVARHRDMPAAGVPHFLHDHASTLVFEPARGTIDRFLEKLREQVETFHQGYMRDDDVGRSPKAIIREIYNKLRQISCLIAQSDKTQRFKLKVIEEVLQETKEEVRNLSGEDYKQDLSLEKTFIVRAGPIFNSAKAVYATSIDAVSKFWISREQESNAQVYTRKQPKSTKRLFVFSNPKNAHQYRNVLAAHHKRYGAKGGVFMCSFEQYEKLMNTVVAKDYSLRFLKRDFGILVFEGDKPDQQEVYEAKLSDTRLELERKWNHASTDYIVKIQEAFEKFADRDSHEYADTYKISRWQDVYSKDDAEWKNALRWMFQLDESSSGGSAVGFGDVYHLVFFGDDVRDADLTRAITSEISTLTAMWKKDGSRKLVKEVWFGSRTGESAIRAIKPIDLRFEGEIQVDNQFNNMPYCFLLRFENIEDLVEYYGKMAHSEAREVIFRALDPGGTMNELYDALRTTRDKTTRAAVYKAIEAYAGRYMFRADYLEHNDLDLIMKIKPKSFELPDN